MVAMGRYPVRPSGPLAGWVHPFREELVCQGFTAKTAQDNAYVLAHLSRWLHREGLDPAKLGAGEIAAFAVARQVGGYRRWRRVESLRLMLGYLRDIGIVPPEPQRETDCPVERVLAAYREYLDRERRLGERTIGQRVYVAGRFLLTLVAGGKLWLDQLKPEAVVGFIAKESSRYAANSMKMWTTGLRSLLRYLFVTGAIDRDLTEAVPSVAGWQQSALPTTVDTSVVMALLDSCDRTTMVGRRDFAVLMLLARLGLRAQEVAALRLEDIDWRAGELVIHGKGGRIDRLPLPVDVGTALTDYLQHARRTSTFRQVFLRSCGPDAPMARQSVVTVSRCASQRVGIATVAAHQLRHRLASQVLAQGGTLAEIAQLLRHHSEATTAIYAKVDRLALEAVVRPWPQVSGR